MITPDVDPLLTCAGHIPKTTYSIPVIVWQKVPPCRAKRLLNPLGMGGS